MKHSDFYMYLDSATFFNEKSERIDGMFAKLYKAISQHKRKQKIRSLLSELTERRKKLDELISTVQYLEALFDDDAPESHEHYNKSEKLYINIVDKMFECTSRDISFFIIDLAQTSQEANVKIPPEDVYILINYNISTGIKNFLTSQHQQKCAKYQIDSNALSYFTDSKRFSYRIYVNALCERYNKLYRIALDKRKTNLALLLDSNATDHKENSESNPADITSELFRSQLSKYVFTWRTKNNMTQNELAQKSGVDRTMIAKIEKLQQNASIETTAKLLSTMDAQLMIVGKE